jgi:glycosyltransferase involved in cell wall biosynthesis
LKYVSDGQHLIGHFGSYGADVRSLLYERLPAIMESAHAPSLLLLGEGSDRFRVALLRRHPSWAPRVHAGGYLPAADLGAHIAACDLFVQPYPDGITSRRTSAMACLSRARPIVTTSGRLTEPLWAESGAVAIADVADSTAFASAALALLADDEARVALGACGEHVYDERFSVTQIVNTLRAA